MDVGPNTTAFIEDMTAFIRDYRLVNAAARAIGANPILIEADNAE
jgi:hypothetical protein